jgi:hypothetical protein
VKTSDRVKNFFYYFSLIVLIAIAGLRYKVGGDSFAYLRDFENIPVLRDIFIKFDFSKATYEPLWYILSSFCKSIVNDFAFFQIVHSTIVNSIVFWFIKKYTPFKFTAIFFYYISLYLYFNTEILREALSICCLLVAYPYFTKGKWIKYYMLSILAVLFHFSALILFVFPLFKRFRFDAKNFLFLFGMSILLVVFSEQLLGLLIGGLEIIGIEGRYEVYRSFKLNYKGIIANYILLVLIPTAVIYIDNKINGQNVFKDLFYIYFLIAFAIIVFDGLFRLRNYMSVFCMVYWTNFVFNVFQWQFVRRLRKAVVCFLFILYAIPNFLYYFNDTSKSVGGTKMYDLWHPYYSIFNPKEHPKREQLYDAIVGNEKPESERK